MEITVPIDERDLLIGVLRNDPRILSHFWGAQIHYLQHIQQNNDRAQQRFDEILQAACELFGNDPMTLARIVRTMLVTYDINPDVARLPFLDRFDSLVSRYVIENHKNIKVFE